MNDSYDFADGQADAAVLGPTGLTYQDVVAHDRVPLSPDMKRRGDLELGTQDIDIHCYTSAAFHQLEMERMWPKVWQFACREEEIPEVGDTVLYELGDHSFMIVRAAVGEIRAFYNSCLHRGTKLCTESTAIREIRCPFHGMCWSLDGTFRSIPCRAGLQHKTDEQLRLPQAAVATWAGFVFINMDPQAMPLEHYLEELPLEMHGRRQADKYIASHTQQILPANWKASMEAFMEAYHIPALHYQTAKFQGADTTQYDVSDHWRHMNRSLQPIGVQTYEGYPKLSEQEIFSAWYCTITGKDEAPPLPPGESARAFIVKLTRSKIQIDTQTDITSLPDAEVVDVIQYQLFPNMILFRGVSIQTIYRFRPNGNDPDSCIFDLYFLADIPPGTARPAPAAPVDMAGRSYQGFGQVPPFLGLVYDQDRENLRNIQKGMKASRDKKVMLNSVHERRIRHFHEVLSRYVGTDGGR